VELTLLASRLLLAAVFLLAGATKLVDAEGLRKALREFGLPPKLAPPAAVLLPVLELTVAVALIPTSLAWYGAWGAVALLTVFLIAVGIAMLRGLKPDCHCFGQLHSATVGRPLLIRNSALAGCAVWVVSRGRLHSGPELWTWLASLHGNERKAVIVAACVAVFCFFYVLDGARPGSRSTEAQTVPAVDDVDEVGDAPVQEERAAPERIPVMGIGLPIGTTAPEFELPGITGEKRSLQSLREGGHDALLIFSSPFCESCTKLASELVRWMREIEGLPNIVLISRGTPKENLAKLQGFDTSRVLLQREFEVSEAYDCDSTPSAVLVGADGLIRSDLAVGGIAIKELLSSCAKRGQMEEPNRQAPA
jgi:peroxiredoxin